MQPPVAKTVPHERTFHADVVDDPYAWLADKQDEAVLDYLKAENAYTEDRTSGQAALREEIFQEIKRATQETDLSVPSRKGDWWYYSRTEEGRQYAVHCRLRADGDLPPAVPEDGSALPGEVVLLDGNELAEGHGFFSLGTFELSPDDGLLAYSVDFAGDERFTLKIRDLRTGADLADEIPNTGYGSAWSLDGSMLFYLTVDEAWRPYRVHRHAVGSPVAGDRIVFEEPDERFWVGVGLTRSERYVVVSADSKITSEVRLLDSADPSGDFVLVAARETGVEYSVDHWFDASANADANAAATAEAASAAGPARAGAAGRAGDLLFILHNRGGRENFELALAEPAKPGEWTPLIEHREDTRLLSVDAFAGHLVVEYRRSGLTGVAVHPIRDGRPSVSGTPITFDEPLYTVGVSENAEFRTDRLRLGYTSLVTPSTVYDYDMTAGRLDLLKRQPVLGDFDPERYEQRRLWATAVDGTRVPISLVHRKEVAADGRAPAVLYGYGSYESSIDPYFSVARLSLLDRGFVFAVAHVRGGGEMGRRWYEDGKLLHKRNTFTDFAACARQLVAEGWTAAERLVARGGSAGGLLMGAAANIAPECFRGILAEVPFVDALNTILDPSLPLTVVEWEEWGNPLESEEVYRYMKSYSPYENIAPHGADPAAARRGETSGYPAILATTSLNDTRVQYHEPAKWIARLRAEAPGGDYLLKTEMEAGHGGRSGRYDAWREEAFNLAWVITVLDAQDRLPATPSAQSAPSAQPAPERG